MQDPDDIPVGPSNPSGVQMRRLLSSRIYNRPLVTPARKTRQKRCPPTNRHPLRLGIPSSQSSTSFNEQDYAAKQSGGAKRNPLLACFPRRLNNSRFDGRQMTWA